MSDERSEQPVPPQHDGLQYAKGAIEKLRWMAQNPPAGILAGNVSSQLESCAQSIQFEINYLREKNIQ